MALPFLTPKALFDSERAFAVRHGLDAQALQDVYDLRGELFLLMPTDFDKIALWIAAPVLAGFAVWIARSLNDSGAAGYGVMREGAMIARLLDALFGLKVGTLAFNRHFSLLAAAACGDDEALLNWLVRTRLQPLTHAGLAALAPRHAVPTGRGDDAIDLAEGQRLVAQWRADGQSPLQELTRDAASKMLLHWRSVVPPEAAHVALLDFACAGNIQRSLQTLLRHHGIGTRLTGFNFATTRGTVWAKQQGCILHGFLSEDGAPSAIGEAYGRTPELMEIFAAAPLGPLMGYDQAGQALWGAAAPQPEAWRRHIVEAAKFFYDRIGNGLTPDLCRCLWGRLLLQPSAVEAQALGDMPLDVHMDGTGRRLLAPVLQEAPEGWTKTQTAWPAGSLLRQQAH